ncbi:MAG: 50S ribosomal protein L3 [Candidatus Pacebacteria bacterium]|nr:50S ribosomal protein L3 [Candidatus Paceibacterota bacterium]
MKLILGKKLGMTQFFDENGTVFPVTLIEAYSGKVVQVKTEEKDGYEAVQLGFVGVDKKKLKKPQVEKPYRYLKEVRGKSELSMGDDVLVDSFSEGEKVNVRGVSKGKGFAGGMKRHNFSGAPASHGTKKTHRTIGSIGSAFPQRVIKGRKMPGRMGADRVTVKNLKVVKIDSEKNTIALCGAVPGRRGAVIIIESI